MLPEIIRKLAKTNDNTHLTSEYVLEWAKRIEVQGAQAAVIDSLSDTKEFDIIQTARHDQKQKGLNLHATVKCPQGKKI